LIKIECNERENKNGEIDVEVKCKTKNEQTISVTAGFKLSKADAGRTMDGLIQASVLLKNFKAMEPEI
jgi:hypothetical protein